MSAEKVSPTPEQVTWGKPVEPEYLTPERVEADDGAYHKNECMFRYVTKPVENDGVFGEAVYDLMAKIHSRLNSDRYAPEPRAVLMTTEERWSGYSEFTITSTWTEVILTVPEWNMAQRWDNLPAFFKALGDGTSDRGEGAW